MLRYWKLWGLATVIFIALASSAYAYWRINAPSSPTLYATVTYPPLELRMELDKTEFRQGEEILIHFSYRNLNDKQVNITFSYLLYFFGFRVLDKNDAEFFTTEWYGRATTLDFVTLEPYGQFDKTLPWDQTNHPSPEGSTKQAAPNTYKIIGFTGPILQINLEEFIPAFRFETPPIQITIS